MACLAALALLLAAQSQGATILEKRVTVDVGPGATLREQTSLKVLLEGPSDLETWASYPIYLDEHRRLESLEAWTSTPDGQRQKVRRKDQDRVEYAGEGVLYGSQEFHLVEFPGLATGSRIEIAYEISSEPYFASSQLLVLGEEPIAELELTVRGSGLRWRLDGPAEGIEVEETASGVTLRGRDLEGLDPPSLAAGGAARYPVLRYAWGSDASWNDVARWYGGLLAQVPRDPDAVRRLAAELTTPEQSPRQRLEALVAHLRRKVRYVAVEIGIGGYQPSPPAEVLERKWGDCKDKSLLLVELLRAVDVDAHLALVLLDEDRRIEPAFPSPGQFNHAIVAVPAGAVQLNDGDPVAGGYLFIDPTQTRGGVRWLHAGVQDQDALVVTGEGGELVRTPIQPADESRLLVVDVEVSPEGDAWGRAGLLLGGSAAARFLRQMESAPPERVGEAALEIFERLLPAARLERIGWEEVPGEVPMVRMSLAVELDSLAGVGGSGRASLRLPGLLATPEPRQFDDLEIAATYPARSVRSVWHLTLPEGWCPPTEGGKEVNNAAGSFRQNVIHEADGRVTVERRSELSRRWFEPGELDALKELALAERRAQRRRIRLSCEKEPSQRTER